MERITFGIDSPKELLEKLRFEGSKLKEELHPYDVFNFFITASVLYEWVTKHYKSSPFVKEISIAVTNGNALTFPNLTVEWIIDNSCIPNNALDYRFDILNALRACFYTANASKHYYWFKNNPVTAIETNPQIKDWYQYFFTSVETGLYIEIDEQYYNLQQIEGILLQFYSGLIEYLESQEKTHKN